jgi:hypothetical protein
MQVVQMLPASTAGAETLETAKVDPEPAEAQPGVTKQPFYFYAVPLIFMRCLSFLCCSHFYVASLIFVRHLLFL